MNIEAIYALYLACGGVVTTDSRHCPVGSLFVALRGDNFDGNKYAQQAVADGCKYAIVDNASYADNIKIFAVADTLATLQALAHHHRKQLGTPIIAITGTNGKTTTKELLAATLSQKYNVLYTLGNLNNHIGVPLTLLRLTSQHEVAVVEMGANHPNEIKVLAEIAAPNYGLITNVGKAHLEGFGSFEGVIRTKCELYDYLRTTGGHLFRHADNDILAQHSHGMEQTTYGTVGDALLAKGVLHEGSTSLAFTLTIGNESMEVATQLVGGYNLPNALAAACVASYMGVASSAIKRALEEYLPQNNRSQLAQGARNTLLIDAYNANPTSMMAALTNFATLAATPKGVILGDMRELGADSEAEHATIVAWLQVHPFDRVWLVGEEFSQVAAGFPCYPNTATLLEALQAELPTSYHLLIKGSRGIRLEQCIECL